MSRSSANLILGIAIGAIGVLLLTRVRQVVEDDDPEALADRLAENLRALEARLSAGGESARAAAH